MKLSRYIVVFVLLTFVGITIKAQEQLRPLNGNISLPVIPATQNANKKVTVATSIDLPFFDDFSYAHKYPYPIYTNWIDSNAYVNTGFAIAPITIGVATFDGLNKKGYPYNLTAPVSVSASADTLTSRPIQLDSISNTPSPGYYQYSPSDSIALTFYYQAEGFGEAPESNDSLCLDFFKPKHDSDGVWTKVWGKAGYNPSANDTNFYRVKIFITDTAYFHDGFQFRFRNKATTSGSLDHWHIDYVQIKKFYYLGDSTLDDVSFVYKSTPFLKNYWSMPYNQYQEATERGPGFHNYFRSNFDVPRFSVYDYTVTDESTTLIPSDPYGTFATGILPYKPSLNQGYYTGNAANAAFTYSGSLLPTTFSDSTFFTIQHIITTTGDLKKSNDTLTQIQKFSNYYAYDDGTAEQAYYLGGTNSYGAKTAVRYKLNVADTLKSVRIYFDPVTEGGLIVNSGFRINVWGSAGTSPGGLIYKDSLMYPKYIKDSLLQQSGANRMPTYELTSCLPLAAGTYFIGIQQVLNQPLNIGFDRNTNHKNALYYNLTGTWQQSAINGSIMINPVMGCVDPPVIIGLNTYQKTDKIKLYPNPAQNTITINLPGNQLANADLEITNALGQTVLTTTFTSNEPTDISGLSNGLYFIHIKGNNLNVSSQKLIISR
ncbi:MAG: T9SS type A sorting domain-containing protein [Bacteroidota bacterium]